MIEESESAERQPVGTTADGAAEEPQAAPDEAWIGKLLGERYRIDRTLSQGGMGVVYAARHVVLEIDVAVKVLLDSHEPSRERRFVKEARLACTVRHPNTVQIMDFGVFENCRAYLVMELLQGRTLSSEIEKGRLAVLRVCRIGAQIARGLQAIHDRGIVHCDIKPSNVILVRQDGTSDFVKIVDFGIARSMGLEAGAIKAEPLAGDAAEGAASRSSQTGGLVGTPRYMSPEQCQGLPLDERSDQYSLGCMLYEMLTGEPPFRCATTHELMQEHILGPVEPPRERVPQLRISSALEGMLLRMMAKDPALRLSSLHEVEETLLAEAELIDKGREEIATQPGRGDRRAVPRWTLGIGLLGLALAVAAGTRGAGLRRTLFRHPAPLLLAAEEPQATHAYRKMQPVQRVPSVQAAVQPAASPRIEAKKQKPLENSSALAIEAARRAAEAQDFSLALKEFERAVILCEGAQTDKSCAALDHKLALERGQIFERQTHWSEALHEYQKAAVGPDEKERVLAQAAMARLAPHFGKVVIRAFRDGRCQQETRWLEPGHRHMVKLGGMRQEIQVDAGQTKELGTCP